MQSRKNRRKTLLIGIAVTLVVIAGVVLLLTRRDSEPVAPDPVITDNTTSSKDVAPQQPKLTRFIATGDIIGHAALNKAAKTADGYDYVPFMKDMEPLFNAAALRFCNQSTLIGGERFPITGFPDFNAPAQLATNMAEIGCNIVNTASNHSFDKTQEVIDSNVTIWNNIPNMLAVAGQYSSAADSQRIRFFEKDGLKYAFLAYTAYSNKPPQTTYGVAMYSRDLARKQISEAKQNGARFIVVSIRWGTEYAQTLNAFQESESQFLADQGVSLVLGHGPHVLQPVKRLTGQGGNETLVWYSLGNFLHAQLEIETIFNGVAVMDIDPSTATIKNVSFLPTYMHYEWSEQEAAQNNLLARRNFTIVPLDKAKDLPSRARYAASTIDAQRNRLQQTINTYTSIPLTTSDKLGL